MSNIVGDKRKWEGNTVNLNGVKFQKKEPTFKPLISPTKKVIPQSNPSDEDYFDVSEIPCKTHLRMEFMMERQLKEFGLVIARSKVHIGMSKMKLEKNSSIKLPSFVIVDSEGHKKWGNTFHCLPPIVLKTQLFADVGSATQVEKELDEMKSKNKIRVFRLLSDREDYAIVETADYIRQIEFKRERWINGNKENETNGTNEEVEIVDSFLKNIVPNWKSYAITRQQLRENLKEGKELLSEREIAILMECGLLITKDHDTFWLSIPDVGPFVKQLMQGRKELIRMIGRSRWKEMFLSRLDVKNIKYTSLGSDLHVEDLVGREAAELINTASGRMIRLKESK
eukprot:TRINITY_DN1497_c0_g1_i1.p1 TRINITY_DN1497_c0_g1~~TRINITY_DN1497_c0_g1_i1.p1  ORF type:complete len:340 (-),score=126.87 TRINITY_DN1497_c0_g1_i1:922-1941(-)